MYIVSLVSIYSSAMISYRLFLSGEILIQHNNNSVGDNRQRRCRIASSLLVFYRQKIPLRRYKTFEEMQDR